jgi:hypothetical protein
MGVWRLQNGGFRAVYSENRTEMAMRILSAPLAFDGGVAMPSAACQGLLTGLLDREPAPRAGAAAAPRRLLRPTAA